MAFSLAGEATPSFSYTEADSKVAGPRPEDRRVGERHIKMVAIMRDVRMPDGLGEGKQQVKIKTVHFIS